MSQIELYDKHGALVAMFQLCADEKKAQVSTARRTRNTNRRNARGKSLETRADIAWLVI